MKISVTCLKPITIDHNKRLVALELNILSKGQVSAPLRLQLEDLDDRRHDQCLVDTEANVVDLLHDDVDARLDVLLLKDGACRIPLEGEMSTTSESCAGTKVVIINATEGEHENT